MQFFCFRKKKCEITAKKTLQGAIGWVNFFFLTGRDFLGVGGTFRKRFWENGVLGLLQEFEGKIMFHKSEAYEIYYQPAQHYFPLKPLQLF